ncbi:inositol monophosphatase family protein [Synechococcus sp. UW140]|uniref:inositol monophosphatase family protein n=1 Tax=Synechococcus sp. UW140 TaxID=368503 RepID=UPI000E0EC614|nr:inositol monophosphatase family protein [Synechococcus sp. UW140]
MVAQALTSQQLNAVHQLLDRVAERQLQDFGHILSDLKPDGTLITTCDRWSDQAILEGLEAIAPGEGVLSEEGSKLVPSTQAYWVVDPLDGTTNFAAGIPYWAISVARWVDGAPSEVFLDVPSLRQRIVAIRAKGAWRNGKRLTPETRTTSGSACISLCSRAIRVLQQRPDRRFPGKIRLLGVASLNLLSVALGQTVGALEATPKIWDMAAAWLVLSELGCPLIWLDRQPADLVVGEDLESADFPVVVASNEDMLERLHEWGQALLH